MLAGAAAALQAIDTVLTCAGVVGSVVFAVHLVRSGRWRDPLADVRPSGQGPSFLHVVGVVAALILMLTLLRVGVPPEPPGQRVPPGSDLWHRLVLLDGAAKLLAVPLMLYALTRRSSFATARSERREPLDALRIALATLLIIIPVVSTQLLAGDVVLHLLHPGVPPPMHDVLEALHSSAWNRPDHAPWGTVQLIVSAVVVAPLAEELFFRGLLLSALWRATRLAWLSIVLAGAAFGMMHCAQPQDVLPLATMGVVLGYVRLRFQSLTACILVHALFNARTMIAALIAPELLQ